MRKVLPIGAALECILLGLMLAGEFTVLLYPALLLALLVLIFSFLLPRPAAAAKSGEGGFGDSAEEKRILDENIELRERLQKALKKVEDLEANSHKSGTCLRELLLQHHRILHAVDAQKKLAGVINEKTETATIEMTNHIYSIADWSKKVEDLIQNVMGQLSSGDVGLRRQAGDLEEELHRIEKLIEVFKDIKNDYIIELERIGQTLHSVDNFTETITDLAERTNVLAINASIEAARAGQAGRGFAVIASEVQGLAGNTMKIAEEISTTVEISVHTVKDSIGNYGERIETAVSKLAHSGEQHARIIEQLGPQIEKVSRVAEESRQLSSEVTQNINEVTVHLQYQDNVRQVLEHLLEVLVELTRRGEQTAHAAGQLDHGEANAVEEEVKKLVTAMFTTREEWNAFGYQLDEGAAKTKEEEKREGDFEGDVTLF